MQRLSLNARPALGIDRDEKDEQGPTVPRRSRHITPAPPRKPDGSARLAVVLALLAMLGTASGFWAVAHHAIDHAPTAVAASEHACKHAHHDHDHHKADTDALPASDTPVNDVPAPTQHDCPTCDLITSAQVVVLTFTANTVPVTPAAPQVGLPGWASPPLASDLTAWSARPPPSQA